MSHNNKIKDIILYGGLRDIQLTKSNISSKLLNNIKFGDQCEGASSNSRPISDIKFLKKEGDVCEDLATTIKLYDSWGDGWNSAVMTITDSEGSVVYDSSGTFQDGTEVTANVVLQNEEYTVEVTAGYYPSEISWTIEIPEGVILSGGAPYSGSVNPCEVTIDTDPPVPQDLNVVVDNTTISMLDTSFEPADDASPPIEYDLYLEPDATLCTKTIQEIESEFFPQNSFTDITSTQTNTHDRLDPGTEYYAVVIATDSIANKVKYNCDSDSTLADTEPPEIPEPYYGRVFGLPQISHSIYLLEANETDPYGFIGLEIAGPEETRDAILDATDIYLGTRLCQDNIDDVNELVYEAYISDQYHSTISDIENNGELVNTIDNQGGFPLDEEFAMHNLPSIRSSSLFDESSYEIWFDILVSDLSGNKARFLPSVYYLKFLYNPYNYQPNNITSSGFEVGPRMRAILTEPAATYPANVDYELYISATDDLGGTIGDIRANGILADSATVEWSDYRSPVLTPQLQASGLQASTLYSYRWILTDPTGKEMAVPPMTIWTASS